MKKKTSYYFFTLCLALMLNSCEPPYSGSKIIEIKNEFYDAQNQPINGLSIRYTTEMNDGYYFGYNTDTFSRTTNTEGKISISTFKPFQKLYAIYEGNTQLVNFYSELKNLTTETINYQRFYVLRYDESVDLYLNFSNSNPVKQLIDVTFSGIGNEDSNANLNEDSRIYRVKTNQTVTIKYTVYDSQTKSSQEFTSTIAVGTSTISQTITL
jgi:hypothetical protein